MPFLPILLSKIKLNHVSELGVCGGCLKFSIVHKQCAPSVVSTRPSLSITAQAHTLPLQQEEPLFFPTNIVYCLLSTVSTVYRLLLLSTVYRPSLSITAQAV